MSDALKKPDLPPGALVETFNDGSALRNDEVKLIPAVKNRWYILATVAGEQGAPFQIRIDQNLHEKNRRFWNGWMCQNMSADERMALSNQMNLPEGELAPLSDDETQQIQARFKTSFPDQSPSDTIPNPDHDIDLRRTHFSCSLSLEHYYLGGEASFRKSYFAGRAMFRGSRFANSAYFQEAHFARRADFQKTHFNSNVVFPEAHFVEEADFQETHFGGNAEFQKTNFAGDAFFLVAHFAGRAEFQESRVAGTAYFQEARFAGPAVFQQSHFFGHADFKEAYFTENADFSDGAFKAATSFNRATFKTQVPTFYQREMHQDTTFGDASKHWPEATSDNAEDGKQAYTRLRQIAVDNHNPDLEHFFLRQEMRCKEALAKTFVDRLMFKGYRWIADSGISVVRPATGLALIWLIPGFAYLFRYLYLNRNTEKIIAANSELPALADLSVLGSFGLSFANLFAFLGLNRLYFQEVIAELDPWLSLLAGFQTISGVVLLFLLGLGLRNRFRLK